MVGSYHVTINPFIFFWDVQKLQKIRTYLTANTLLSLLFSLGPAEAKTEDLISSSTKFVENGSSTSFDTSKSSISNLLSFASLIASIDSLIVLAFECCKQALRVMFKCRHCERSLTKFGQRTGSNMETFGKSFGNSKWFPISARTIDYNKLLWIRVVSFLSKIQYHTIDYHGHD